MKRISILRRMIRFITPRQFRRTLNAKGEEGRLPPHERRTAAESETAFRDRHRMGQI